jgi:hypothetical protein
MKVRILVLYTFYYDYKRKFNSFVVCCDQLSNNKFLSAENEDKEHI